MAEKELKEKISDILFLKTVDGGTKEIMKIIREYENELVQANAMLESIEELLDGKEVSDFMLSFSVVRKVNDLISHSKENAYYAGLAG